MPDFFNLIQRQESACNTRQWLGRSHADGRLFTAWLAALRLQASYLNQWCPRRGAGGGWQGSPRSRVPSASGSLHDTQILRPSSRPPKPETLEVGLSNLCSRKPSRRLWSMLKFEKHWLELWDSLFSFVRPGRKTDQEKGLSASHAVTFYPLILLLGGGVFLNQGSKFGGIKTSNWGAAATGSDWNVLTCQQWAGTQNRPLAAGQALKIWPLKSQVGKMPQE